MQSAFPGRFTQRAPGLPKPLHSLLSMNQPIQISNGWVAAMIAALVFDILYPLALGVFARRRLGVNWRYFGYGALIFVLFQLVSRVPITLAIQALIASQLQASRVALIAWIAISALTAGLFEELGRYVGYRWLMKREQKTWAKGVMYGLGHGGIESMLLIAGLVTVTLIQVLALARTDLSTLPLTAEQRALAAQQLAAIAAQPSWAPLLGAWERLWTIPLHVALALVVLQVFRRGSLRWLWLAILAHALVDLVGAGVTPILGLTGIAALLIPEAIISVVGLLSLWTIWALRDRPDQDGILVAEPGLSPLASTADLPEAAEKPDKTAHDKRTDPIR
jgi:uncharacterized membrane protein YhfC